MNTKTYALSAAFAGLAAVLVSIVPLVRGLTDYRSPQAVDATRERPELSSLDNFIYSRLTEKQRENPQMWRDHLANQGINWSALYQDALEAVKAEEATRAEAAKRTAAHNAIAYGTLFGIGLGVFVFHFLWFRRYFRI